ncbi:MAG: hypothetical protein UH242_05955 [Methanobrevibacter sp.]|nr:hypothetical protein [Methanobrevibacter sp.]
MIVSISAVSAADIADSDDLSLAKDDSASLKVDDAIDDLQVEDESPQSAETGDNFTSIQTEIDKEGVTELVLDKDYARAEGDKDIVIKKDFTIDGQGNTISAAESGRIFNVTEGNILTLKNLTLIGGNVNGNGGAIYSEGDLNIIGCTFTNNVASSLGGAIFVTGTANIENCVFKENTALQGAVYNQNEKLTVKNTLFDNNTAKGNSGGALIGSGAAIYTLSPVEVYNSNFTANHAEYDAAAIYYYDTENTAAGVIDNCRFEDNVADDLCGAVYLQAKNGNFNISNTKFINNTYMASYPSSLDYSAALDFRGANLTVTNCEFTNNKGKKYSAIYSPTLDDLKGLLTVDNTKFTGNNAGVSTVAVQRDAKFTNVIFESNDGNGEANAIAIYNSATKAEIKDSIFTNNGESEEFAIYNAGILKVENNTISNGITGPGTIIKQNSSITINPIDNVTYGAPVVVSYSIENRSSNVTVSVDHKNGGIITPAENAVIVVENDKVTVTNLTAGQYVINIVNVEDINIAEKSESAVFNVTKATPVFDVKAYVDERGMLLVNVTTNKDATGKIGFKIDNNQVIPYDILNGTVQFGELTVYPKGTHNVSVSYKGDENYGEASYNTTVEVIKDVPVIDIISAVVNEYGDIVVKANITKGATGNVTFYFFNATGGNLTVPIEIGENGTIEYSELEPFAKGSYNVQIGYDGDANYYALPENAQVDVEVDKIAPVLVVEVGTIEGNISIGVKADNATVNGKVNITVFDNGIIKYNQTKDMVNGVVEEFNLTGFVPGNYKVLAEFLGSDKFYMAFAEDIAEVRETVDMNVTVSVNEYGQIVVVANLTKGATGIVEFTIMNATGAHVAEYNATIVNGSAEFDTRDVLPKGEYGVVAYYSGDDYYDDIEVFGDNATISKEYLNVTPKVTINGNQANIVFTFSGNASGNATAFFLSYGTNATFVINNGTVVIDEIFDNGEQSVLLTYDGDDKYYGFFDVYADFYVKASSFIKAKSVTVVYQNTGKVTVTLTDNNDGKGNNPIANANVVITLNGKTYKGTTNAKGVATISIPAKLVPKAYTAKVSYAGSNVTVGDSENIKFTVKKATPKVSAKKKTFKKSIKVKKYTITLKDNKGKAIKKAKVTIKVGKKTFKATTNAKGKAVFKLKKLTKKAKYNAKVTYKGNKYFNKVTKKVKITIK